MTSRERHASGTAVHGTAAPAAPLAPGPAALVHTAAPSDKGPPRNLSWENLFLSITPVQQQEILSLAGRQGLVYSHQVPVPPQNLRIPAAGEIAALQFLGRLLGNQGPPLEPAQPRPVAVLDRALDDCQREAVARALATPDLCLIQGLPGTGKSRVTAEILAQAAARGWRVLFLAPSSAAIDRVLETVGTHEAVCALRCLGKEENPETLPPAVRALTFTERLRRLTEETGQQVRATLDSEEQVSRRYQQQHALWPSLEDLARQSQQLEDQRAELARLRAECPARVEREAQQVQSPAPSNGQESSDSLLPAAAFAAALRDCFRRRHQAREHIEAGLKDARRQIEERRQELAQREPALDSLRPLVEARRKGRWWTPTWWRALFRGDVQGQLAGLEDAHKKTRESLAGLEEQIRTLEEEDTRAEELLRADRSRLVNADIARRTAELEERDAVLRDDQALLENKGQNLCRGLDPGPDRPPAMTLVAVAAAQEAWEGHRAHQEKQLVFAREWGTYLKEAAGTLAARLPNFVNLVAGTTADLARDQHFGDPAGRGAGFDLLVLEEADQVTEAELLKLAQRARRWVLVGAPAGETGAGEASPGGDRLARGVARPTVQAPSVFQRLWNHLHCNPRCLPYGWVQENGRLCCRLRPVPAEQRSLLEVEHVADSPEIELRILVLPRTQPLLAEVVFPPATTLQQAKGFIFRELEELAVQAAGPGLRWAEEADKWVLHLGDGGAGEKTCIPLEPGVCENLAPHYRGNSGPADVSWRTCRMEFDQGLGWHRERAEDWVFRHLGVRDLGRTVRLEVPHRMRPNLAAFLGDLLFEDAGPWSSAGKGKDGEALGESALAAEFVSVPPLHADAAARPRGGEARGRTNGARVTVPARGGAGLELDLSSPRHGDRLPTELRALLPAQGMVNFFEAQAVVRRLEHLAANAPIPGAKDSALSTIAVVALYPAQAQLIHLLLDQSPRLKGSGLWVEVGDPGCFRQREAGTLLLSLTRSHSHRAVSFGEGPQALALALTRVRDRLILFGDPGTLARRTQWDGPVEHLDAVAAARERDLITRLLSFLQGQGRHPEVFQLSEGNGA